jgi:hypothetical protein
MRNELTGRRVSRLSTIQREIVSTRCKAIDIDWVWYCDACPAFLMLIEETSNAVEGKAHFITERVARALGVPAFVAQDMADGWRVKRIIPSDREIRVYTDDQMADFIMSVRDAHAAACSGSVMNALTWEQEKKKNGGSAWRHSPTKN